jgi:hypothetical protein
MKTLRPWLRRTLLGVAGVAAVAIVLSAASKEESDAGHKTAHKPAQPAHVAISQRTETKPRLQAMPLRIELERLHQQGGKVAAEPEVGNVFKAISWYVPPPPPPPPPPPKPVPPPPPTAPPMPFSYLGRYEDGGKLIIFLVRGDRIYTVAEGEVIENTYRVERLTGSWLELTYLPLNIKQTIGVGAS